MSDRVTHKCPFPDCDWQTDYYTNENGDPVDAYPSVRHYEQEHAGTVKIQVTLEFEQCIGTRDTTDIRNNFFERWSDKGHDVAHVRTEVIDEADDHSQTKDAMPGQNNVE